MILIPCINLTLEARSLRKFCFNFSNAMVFLNNFFFTLGHTLCTHTVTIDLFPFSSFAPFLRLFYPSLILSLLLQYFAIFPNPFPFLSLCYSLSLPPSLIFVYIYLSSLFFSSPLSFPFRLFFLSFSPLPFYLSYSPSPFYSFLISPSCAKLSPSSMKLGWDLYSSYTNMWLHICLR